MTERIFNGIEILILAAILFGALSFQFFLEEEPCPLCLLQRLFMFGIGVAITLNLRLGVQKRFYGFAIISAILGAIISLRQIAFHICPGFPKFGIPFLGISLYTWSFFIFSASIAYNALMMVIFRQEKQYKMSFFDHLVIILLFIAGCVNVVTSFYTCGFGPCLQ